MQRERKLRKNFLIKYGNKSNSGDLNNNSGCFEGPVIVHNIELNQPQIIGVVSA